MNNKEKIDQTLTIKLDELAKFPYADLSKRDSRQLYIAPVLKDDGKWDYWIPDLSGNLISLQAEPVRQFYYCKSPNKDTDIFFEFYQLLVQHLSFKEIVPLLKAIEDDIVNIGSVLSGAAGSA